MPLQFAAHGSLCRCRSTICLFLLALLVLSPASAAASASPDAGHGSQAAEPTNPLDAYWAWKARLKDKGIDFTINYTSEELAAVQGGDSDALVHAGQLSFTGQADMERLAGWKGAAITLSVSKRDGQGINARSGIGALLGPQEIFGRGNITRISQFWLDQKLLDDRVSLRVGRVNAGSDFEAFDCHFINLSYCGNQVGNIVSDYWYNYPISQWGAIAKIRTGSRTSIKVGAYQVNPRNLKRGLFEPFSPSGGTGVLLPVEFGWTPRLGAGTDISVKFGGWYSSADREDVYLDSNHAPAAQSDLPFLQRKGSYGGYSSTVIRLPSGKGRSLMAFFNATLADRRTSTVDRSLATGLVYTGLWRARPHDQIGLAVSYNHLNSRVADYRTERALAGRDTLPPGTGENAVELFYGFQLDRFLQFRPDLQWIRHPGGIASNPDAVILGARTSISF